MIMIVMIIIIIMQTNGSNNNDNNDGDHDDDVDVDNGDAGKAIQSSTSLPRGNQVDGLPRVCSLVHTEEIWRYLSTDKSVTLGSKIYFFVRV